MDDRHRATGVHKFKTRRAGRQVRTGDRLRDSFEIDTPHGSSLVYLLLLSQRPTLLSGSGLNQTCHEHRMKEGSGSTSGTGRPSIYRGQISCQLEEFKFLSPQLANLAQTECLLIDILISSHCGQTHRLRSVWSPFPLKYPPMLSFRVPRANPFSRRYTASSSMASGYRTSAKAHKPTASLHTGNQLLILPTPRVIDGRSLMGLGVKASFEVARASGDHGQRD